MSDPRIEEGHRIRAEILGPRPEQEASEEFTPDFRVLTAEFAWSSLWGRPGLDRRSRSLVTLGILIALRAEPQLREHFPAALRNKLTLEEVEEVIYHAMGYAGFPAAHLARTTAKEVLADEIATRSRKRRGES